MHSVSVDNDFARFGAKSYAINKITSVEVREERPHAMGCAYGLFILGAIVALQGFASFSEPGGAVFLLITAAVIGGIGYWQWKRSQIIVYKLFLITSASETQAFVTRDAGEVADLRQRIENAMMHHSRG